MYSIIFGFDDVALTTVKTHQICIKLPMTMYGMGQLCGSSRSFSPYLNPHIQLM